MREECWKEFESPEAQKITATQRKTGNQYLTNVQAFDIAHTKQALPPGAMPKAIANPPVE
jgi:hypothetical protein